MQRATVGLFLGLLAGALLVLAGCGGGGGGGNALTGAMATPEEAVAAMLGSWRVQGGGPALPLGPRAQSASTGTGKSITFRDLSGNSWTFDVVGAERLDDSHASLTVRLSSVHGTDLVRIIFQLFLSEGRWQLDDLDVPEEDIDDVIVATDESGAWGYVRDSVTGQPLQGATVSIYPEGSTDPADAQTTTTNADGYFAFADLEAGTYTLVIGGQGYEQKTMTVTVTAPTTTDTSTSTDTGTGTGTGTGTSTGTAAGPFSGSIGFGQLAVPNAPYELYAGMQVTMTTGMPGTLVNDGTGNFLIFQTPPSGPFSPTDDIEVFPDGIGDWVWDSGAPPVSLSNQGPNSTIIRPDGTNWTFRLRAPSTGRIIEVVVRVTATAGIAAADRRAGDLTLEIVSSSEITP